MNYLEREFRDILNKYGHYALLVHSDKEKTCKCYNKTTSSHEDDCPICFGTGFPATKFSRILTREQDSNLSYALADISGNQSFGELALPGRFYYLNKEVKIEPHDIILDVNWEGNKAIFSHRILSSVTHVDIKRFENGEPTFQKIYVKSEPINLTVRSKNIINKYNSLIQEKLGR